MPFKSEKQRKWMWANDPEMAKKWGKEESINEMPNFDRGTSGLPRGFVDDYNKIIKKLSKGKGYATLSKSDKKKVWTTLGKIYNESINESNIIKKIDKLAKANKYGTVDGTRMNGKTAREIMAVFMHPKMNSHRRQMVSMKSHELVDLTISLLKPLKIKVESINEAKGYKVTNSELSHMVTYLSDWSKEFDGNMSMGKNLHGKPAQPYYHNRLKKNVSGGKEDALKALIKDWKKYDVSPAMTTKIFKTYHKLSTSKQKFGNPDFWENFLEKQGISVVYESVNEGKWSKIMRSVRKGSKSGPWTIVVYKGKKVLHQRTVKILQQIPAHYEDVLNLKDLAPGIKIGIEDKYGERVYTESVNEKRIKNSPLRRMITSTFKDLDKKFRKKLTKNDINRVASYITSKNRYFPKGLADITADYFYAYKLGKLKINGAIQGTINFQRGYPYKYNFRTGKELESVNESDLGLTYKKGKTVKVTHKKSGKELVIIDKPNVRKEYEKIGFFDEGKENWKEATTSVSVPGYLSPQAFSKSTQNAIDADDEDDEKNESVNEDVKTHTIQGNKRWMIKTALPILKNYGIKKVKVNTVGKTNFFYFKITFDTDSNTLKKLDKELKRKNKKSFYGGIVETLNESVNESMAAPFRRRKSRGLGRPMKVGINELSMAPFSSPEAKQQVDRDVIIMSNYLGKASEQVIKTMMDGVKSGQYDAMDLQRGILTGPVKRTHFGETDFIQQLWHKVRSGFRRYSKRGKLR